MIHFIWMATLFSVAVSVGFLLGYYSAKNE